MWACRMFVVLLFGLNSKGMGESVYTWFVQPNGGLDALMVCLRRFPQLKEVVALVLKEMCGERADDLLGPQLRRSAES